jgi:hypothetical protein
MIKDLPLYGAAFFHFDVVAGRKWLQLVTMRITYLSHKDGLWFFG